MGSSDKKALQATQQKLNEVKAELELYKQRYEPLKDADDALAEKEARRRELEEELGVYEAAKSISDREKEILEAAEKQATELLGQADKEAAQKKKELEELEELLAEYHEEYGKYEDADEIVAEAKKRAYGLVSDAEDEAREIKAAAETEAKNLRTAAETEAKNLRAAAKSEAAEIVPAANREAQEIRDKAREMKAQAEEVLTEARKSAKAIAEDALAQKNEWLKNKAAEGQSLKDSIIMEAQAERDRILAVASEERERLVETSRTEADNKAKVMTDAAERYAERIRLDADKRIEAVSAECEKMKNEATEWAEKAREDALARAAKIVDEGREMRQREQAELDKQREEAAAERSANIQRAEIVARKEAEIKARTKVIDREVEERVNEEYAALQEKLDRATRAYRELKESNSEISERLKKCMDERDALSEKRGISDKEIEGYRRFCEAVGGYYGGAPSDADFSKALERVANYEKLFRDFNKLLKKYNEEHEARSKAQEDLNSANASADKLQAAETVNEFLKNKVDGLVEELKKSQTATREDMLKPVWQKPSFFVSKLPLLNDENISEQLWLRNIRTKSRESGLYFSKRQLNAFHTAHKVHGMSPLVVLAGISGTGKSELPKNYALHGGMQFISVPVKPDWDSPASLFGYYNSIEKRFEATDLLRAIWQMSANSEHSGQMLMVLLDEMNLAHPEQYFADMLSKLETARGTSDAEYDILLGSGEIPERVRIGGNILWTGTMNEDETTKALSDKVIDRSTLITFPRPKTLRGRRITHTASGNDDRFLLHRDVWEKWYAPRYGSEDDLIEKKINEFKTAVEEINGSMSKMGRNLGHRVWQGIEEYIRNHPEVVAAKNDEELEHELGRAFDDAIAFKVMPKLRGVETKGQNESSLSEIRSVIARDAVELTKDFDNACGLNTELFQWHSAEFMTGDDEDDEN